MKSKTNVHSAAPQATGYLYQCRYALLEGIKRISEEDDDIEFTISIESLDDIVFDKGESKDLLQTKHHVKRKADLTDGSTDLWRTIKVWCDNISNLSENYNSFLITTSIAPEGSAAAYLRPTEQRDISKAREILNKHARESTAEKNKWYPPFISLSEDQQKSILENAYIIDGVPSILDINKLLKKKLYWACSSEMSDSFLEQLEGWWFRKVMEQLNSDNDSSISSKELNLKVNSLSERFVDSSFLEADDDIRRLKVNKVECENFIFVHQLKIINIEDEGINGAMKDFYRTMTQRSRWVREGRVLDESLENNDEDLKELWANQFRRHRRRLNSKSSAQEKIKSGQKLYEWVEEGMFPDTHLSFKAPFMIRGSYHYLADELKVGWHIDFKELLKKHKKVK